MDTRDRILPLAGACNFRDLGGYPTRGGGTTRWGVLFRSDTLHELTPADLAVLRTIGLRGVVDLRTATELERNGRGLLASEPITYLHASLIGEEGGESAAVPAPDQGGLAERYLWYLDVGRDALVEAITLLADPANQPAVFHCAAGKDRTGVLAALVLAIVGVENPVIVEDYLLTGSRMPLIMERLRRDPVIGIRIDEVPADRFLVEAETMERFHVLLEQKYGGAREWALAAGVSRVTLQAMTALLTTHDDDKGGGASGD